jgi:glutathione peroxidase-family protein
MMSKLSVKGDDKTPLYQFLTSKSEDPKFGGEIQWNFTKFLFDRNGNPVARFEALSPTKTVKARSLQSPKERSPCSRSALFAMRKSNSRLSPRLIEGQQ